jgi:hypothetical protein
MNNILKIKNKYEYSPTVGQKKNRTLLFCFYNFITIMYDIFVEEKKKA